MTEKPRVHIIVLGGTITMMPQPSGGVVPELDGAHLVATIPGIPEKCELTVATPFLVPGASLTLDQMVTVAELVRAAVQDNAAGVVVVQGTDTIDETSFALDLLLKTEAPVVVTGAMRNPSLAGADGPANLLASIIVASSPKARGQGVLVVLDDAVHSARYVEKTHSSRTSAFVSPAAGHVGEVVEDVYRPFWTIPPLHAANGTSFGGFADVALLKPSLGDDGKLFAMVAEVGFDGVVIEGMGGGHIPARAVDAAASLCEKMPVVLAKRVSRGPVLTATYGFSGSERDLIGRGLIAAGSLSATKARLLLGALIASGASLAQIAESFAHRT